MNWRELSSSLVVVAVWVALAACGSLVLNACGVPATTDRALLLIVALYVAYALPFREKQK